jgi:hypothetical protein
LFETTVREIPLQLSKLKTSFSSCGVCLGYCTRQNEETKIVKPSIFVEYLNEFGGASCMHGRKISTSVSSFHCSFQIYKNRRGSMPSGRKLSGGQVAMVASAFKFFEAATTGVSLI